MPAASKSNRPYLSSSLSIRSNDQLSIALALTIMFGVFTIYLGRSLIFDDGLVYLDDVPTAKADYRVDVNTAQWPELVVLPGIGEKLARSIVDYRQLIGGFRSLDEIRNVPGIGEVKYQRLIEFILPIGICESTGLSSQVPEQPSDSS